MPVYIIKSNDYAYIEQCIGFTLVQHSRHTDRINFNIQYVLIEHSNY